MRKVSLEAYDRTIISWLMMLMDTSSFLLMVHNVSSIFFFFLQTHSKSAKRTRSANTEPIFDTRRMKLMLTWHLSAESAFDAGFENIAQEALDMNKVIIVGKIGNGQCIVTAILQR
ncbi:hypothetical protein CMV_023672 [Castanea mollissima]|uniref:Uncharacterized protein n=1 Tax=Castanea mollissima TaxID=60419 RepID=A0A8J4QPM0_9ROSI|nr:hypothetical protein CMV_023672 [Castanea mollissima]